MARLRHLTRYQPLIASTLKLPYTLTPSALPDGAFPAGWTGATWTISSGKGVCSPTLGEELIADPGLEATYTDGLCASLIKNGSPTLAESADAHGGSKAQEFTAAAGDDYVYKYVTPAVTWYKFTTYAKRTAGAQGKTCIRLYQNGNSIFGSDYSDGITSATYAIKTAVHPAISATANSKIYYPAYQYTAAGGIDTVIVDDMSLKTMAQSSLMALRKARADVTTKAQYTWDRNGWVGVIARANAATNPDTFLMAYYRNYDPTYCYICLKKCVAGTWTSLIDTWSNTPAAGGGGIPSATQWLEIRCSGNTVQLFHNNIQVSTDKTVTDVTGVYSGVFQTGGSQLEGFFVG
jgi:hypothetical protein